MNVRRTMGWLAFAAACYWLYCDYQAKQDPDTWLSRAIGFGWANIILTGVHIGASYAK